MPIDLTKYKLPAQGGLDVSKYKTSASTGTPVVPGGFSSGGLFQKIFSSVAQTPKRIGQAYYQAGEKISGAVEQGAQEYGVYQNKVNTGMAGIGDTIAATGGVLRTGLRTAGAFAQSVYAPLTETAKGVVPVEGVGGSVGQGAVTGAALAGPAGALVGGAFGLGIEALNAGKNALLQVPVVARFVEEHPESLKDFEDALTLGLTTAGEYAATKTAVKTGRPDVMHGPISKAPGIIGKNLADTAMVPVKAGVSAYDKGRQLAERARVSIAKKNVEPQLEQSAGRLAERQGIGQTKVKDPLETYDEFSKMEKGAKGDIKQDFALNKVGEKIGNEYDKVIKMRQGVGATMSEEIKKIGKIQTTVAKPAQNFQQELVDNGLQLRGKNLVPTNTSKVTSSDAKLLTQYQAELRKLGVNPTVEQLDALLSRFPKEIELYRAANNITKVTNGERIVMKNLAELRQALSPDVNPLFGPLYAAKKTYGDLTNFLSEGAKFLGKKTQSGDYARDASVAKSSVQSILNSGKKDYLARLEGLTGYPALDESVLALQAMKDAGNFRGLSLLEIVNEGNVPLTPSGWLGKAVKYGVQKGEKLLIGSPEEQTRAFLQSLKGSGVSSSLPKVENYIKNIQPGMTIKDVTKGKSFEALSDQNLGMKTGLRTTFDRALLNGDVAKVRELLPQMPKEYTARIQNKIQSVIGNQGASAINATRGPSGKANFKNIPDDDLFSALDYMEDVGKKGVPSSDKIEQLAFKVAERYGINTQQSPQKIMAAFRALIEKNPKLVENAKYYGVLRDILPPRMFSNPF